MTDPNAAAGRRFLFLQGPPGPFFHLLGERIAEAGGGVHRINLNGGDRYDWPGAVDYRGTMARWPLFVDRYMVEHGITDLVLYGDCRPMHRDACGMAKLRRISVFVMEEGYIRPDWMTFEPDGVNGYSTLHRQPESLRTQAASLPPVPDLPPVTASFRRRAKDSYWYYHRVVTGRMRFPYYRSHRPGWIIGEGIGWILRYLRRGRRHRLTAATLARIDTAPFFLFPLQLSADYQIRLHSPFEDMVSAAEYVIASFARNAPEGTHLIAKVHPLDSGFLDWSRTIPHLARRYGAAGRVHYADGGDLRTMCEASLGVVCVNSTSGTLALDAGKPVIVLGEALYDIPGITHQGMLDAFWHAPEAPDGTLHDAFRRVLQARCLVRGGLASQSATTILVDSVFERLFGSDPRAPPLEAGEEAVDAVEMGVP